MKETIILIIISFISVFPQSTIIINEVMASNSTGLQDEDNEYSDWIELYNTTGIAINLSDYAISDDVNDLRKWTFPSINLQPDDYLLIFASSKNKTSGELHTNFKISASGEDIILSDAGEQIIDQLVPTPIPANISLGRSISDPTQMLFFNNSTPGESNTTQGYTAFSENPMFSIIGGFYPNSVNLELSTESEVDVYFTTDGSDPTTSSNVYTTPILINNRTIIRARVIESNLLPSKIITNTYFINETYTLPVVSLSTNPDNFWNEDIGIYVVGNNGIPGHCLDTPANWNQDWERPIHIEFYESDGTQGFSIDAGVGIHGGCSRRYPQKGLKIMARGEYGSNTIPYKLFPNLEYEEYPSFLLRPSGNDRKLTLMRDALMHTLVDTLDLETQAYRPSIVFINGTYWGIHNIREKINEDYLNYHKNVDPDNIDLLETSGHVVEGDDDHYDAMLNYFENNDISIEANYQTIKTYMDVDNYISYMVSQFYFTNRDWFPNNTKYWRPKTSDGKWRWILYDTDQGFGAWSTNGYIFNMFDYLTDETKYSQIIYRKLIQNTKFKNQFINTFLDYSNTIFKAETVKNKIIEIKQGIEVEIPKHIVKWGNFNNSWEYNIDFLKTFANNRLNYAYNHFKNEFQLGSITEVDLDVNDSDYGEIKLNTLKINSFPWSGNYFQGLPVTLEALSKPGYKFIGWTGDNNSSEKSITYTPSTSNNIIANFQAIEVTDFPKIVINEINYKSLGEEGLDPERSDWVELYNNSDDAIDISGWEFKDEGHTYVIPNETILNSRDFIVLADNLPAFQFYYPTVTKVINESIDFGFSNGGEELSLFNLNGSLVDSVEYNDNSPWPIEPDGNGPTLELKHPDLDNRFGVNWSASFVNGGTPGTENVSQENQSLIDVKVYLEGTYIGSNLMSNTVSQIASFPKSQPFNIEPWNYAGIEQIDGLPNSEIVDWVLVELRNSSESPSIKKQRAALLKQDGNIVDLDGVSSLAFYGLTNGNYHVVVFHKNHLSVMSEIKISID